MYNSFKPGQTWLDNNGKRIQAHGGSVFYDRNDETYYFYGENKEYTKAGSDVWTWGVRAYASKDLYNWEDKGLIIDPVINDGKSSLNPYKAMLDRPHIIYNQKYRKYICWSKIMRYDGSQTELVLSADRFLGPYKVVNDHIRPLGMNAGDFDLAVAPDGKAYYYFERVHSETICADLTEDYTDVTGFYSTHFPHPYPPYVREATAHVVRKGKHYLITSGTTGYLPNPSEVAVADTWHGPYKVLGNPCPSDKSNTTWHSQISSVFKVEGKKDLYIAVADRWCPDSMEIPYDFYRELFEARFSGQVSENNRESFEQDLLKKFQLEKDAIYKVNDISRDTSVSDYIWLPLRFVDPCEKYPDGMIFVDWKDEWRIEDYE